MKNAKQTILVFLLLFIHSIIFSQEVIEVEEEVEETVIESTESNVNSYYSENTADIVTGEIDNTLLIFKGKNSSLYGIKDKNNKILVKPIFNSISSYGSTKDRIKADFGWKKNGVIDKNGNIIIPFEYSSISKYNNIYTVTKDSKKSLMDYFGKPLLKNSYEDISTLTTNYIKVKNNGLYGIINAAGDIVFPLQYEEINYYSSQDWFLLNKNGISSVKDSKGKDIFGKKYTSIAKLDYSFRYIMAEKKGKFGIINKSDQIVAPFEFESIKKNYDNRLFITKQNGKWGVYSIIFDQFIVKPEYDDVTLLSSDYYLLSNGNNKTLINLLINKKFDLSAYDEVRKYITNSKVNVVKNKLRGTVSVNTGKLVVPTNYSYIDINSNYLKAQLPDSRLSDIYDNDGKLLVKNVSSIKRLKDNFSRVSSNGKVGIVGKNEIVIPLDYDLIKNYDNLAVLLVKSKNKYGLVDSKNKFIIPLGTHPITITDGKINWKNKKYTITLGKLIELK